MSQTSSAAVFDINDYLVENGVQQINHKKEKNTNSFQEVWMKVREHFNTMYDSDRLTSKEKEKRQELEHRAIQGNVDAEKILIGEIETYLREENLSGTNFPEYYKNLANGCFQEIYRFGAFYKWNMFPDSPSAVIQGDEQWFKIKGQFIRQDEKLRDENHIKEIIRALQVYHPGLVINESHPHAEFDMEDGSRVTVLVPPRALRPTIIFRRFIVNKFSFVEQAERGTIAEEDIPLLIALSKANLNTIVAGPVESGKSTFLKTIYAERDPKKVAVLIETSRESFLKLEFPDRLVHDFYTTNGRIQDVIRTALRVDHDFVIVQEVRGIEAEGAISGTERGTRGLLMTYHITDPQNTAIQLARHITDEFPARKEANEVRRIAQQLDLGFTMESKENNKKRLTSIYELCYDVNTDSAWINYLVKYEPDTDSWTYNAEISQGLKERIFSVDKQLGECVIEHLKKQSEAAPIAGETIFPCIFKEG
ncbi:MULTISPECIES: ATPase, T2SS/T4P/T4SS family [Bacilli]|uniref:ATPase, T2SS/T4P/T4SS family n=1 Tax=Bacilli TaxID=91061 RepID=UPI00203B9BC6|nr:MULTISPECIES: ATPase, T2SS/T4P/T4SS family [Bacilli]MCM3032960.1 Flp pilus assembly complex ATPase component TadA [Niallia sp. MER 6]MDK8746832.1 ATPase, T2SS/T4P/T4SS family [Streptococcus agalactiae]